MFVGHLAVALGAKKLAPSVGLPWFVAGALFVDLVWPILLIAGVETVRIEPGATAFTPLVFESYPWTHSLLMGVVWGGVLAGIAKLGGVSGAALPIVALTVPSHWVLDFVTHAPDLTLAPGQAAGYGLGLWDSVPATIALEGTLFAGAVLSFLTVRRPRGAKGVAAFWSLVVVTVTIWLGAAFGPPPSTVTGLAYSALALWLLIPWAAWIERTSGRAGDLARAP